MSTVLNVSDAASLGLHAATLLAANPNRRLSNHEIAVALGASEAHLSKVLQRLARHGLVRATRGPGGGFALARSGDDVTLLEVYEAVEGPLKPTDCLLSASICGLRPARQARGRQAQAALSLSKGGGRSCVFGGLLKKLNREVRTHLSKTTLAAAAPVFRRKK